MVTSIIGDYNILFGALGLVLGIYVLLGPRNRPANRFLAFLIFAFSYIILYQGLEMRDIVHRFAWLQRTDDALPFLLGPLMYLYVRTLVREQEPSLRRDALHFLPFVLFVLYLIPWYLSDPAIRPRAEDIPIERPLVTLAKLISVTSYAIATVHVYRRHEERMKEAFSGRDRIGISWLKASGLIFIGIIATAAMMFLVQGAGLPVSEYIDPTIYTLATFWVMTVGVFSILQPEMPTRQEVLPETAGPELLDEQAGRTSAKYRKTLLDEETCDAYLRKLREHLAASRPYLNSELTIGELAEQTSIPAHHLSQVINSRLNRNFYDLINAYRIEEAKRLLLDPSHRHHTVLAIAFDSGFNSKSTFNAVFKQQTGLTPSRFRLQHGGASE